MRQAKNILIISMIKIYNIYIFWNLKIRFKFILITIIVTIIIIITIL